MLFGCCCSGWGKESSLQPRQPLFAWTYGIKHCSGLRCHYDQMSFFLNFHRGDAPPCFVLTALCCYKIQLLPLAIPFEVYIQLLVQSRSCPLCRVEVPLISTFFFLFLFHVLLCICPGEPPTADSQVFLLI